MGTDDKQSDCFTGKFEFINYRKDTALNGGGNWIQTNLNRNTIQINLNGNTIQINWLYYYESLSF